MADYNVCHFLGRIASNIKYGTTQNGERFAAFLLNCEPAANANSALNNRNQYISIRTFKPKVIRYLEYVCAKRNDPCVVIGFVSSYATEVKGKHLTANSINGNHILIIKTRPYENSNKETKEKEE